MNLLVSLKNSSKFKIFSSGLFLFLSFVIVAWGQPARLGGLGAIAGALGYALFFSSIARHFFLAKYRFYFGSLWFALVQCVQLSWMSSIEFQGYYILIVYFFLCVSLGVQFGILTYFVCALKKISFSHALIGASLWTLMEWGRLLFFSGFSWNPIGLALTHFLPSLQFASVFGVYGLSFWVMLTNLVAVKILRERVRMWLSPGLMLWLFLVVFPYLFGIGFLQNHLPRSHKEGHLLRAALVQTRLLPSQKQLYRLRVKEYINPIDQWKKIVSELGKNFSEKWDFIILPEAAVSLPSESALFPLKRVRQVLIEELGEGVIKDFPKLVSPYAEEKVVGSEKVFYVSNLFWGQVLANHFGAELIAGFDHTDKCSAKNFNSAFYLKPKDGRMERYDKQILLPLAEYLPFHFLRSLSKNYGIVEFFSAGNGSKVCGEKIPFSPSICYEETFPNRMREGRVKGAQLFVNLTNDNYFPDSSLHSQHLYHARLRSVENGVPLLRACNSGISAAIDCFGRIVSSIPVREEGVLVCPLNMYHFSTLYQLWGDSAILLLCSAILFFFFVRRSLLIQILEQKN